MSFRCSDCNYKEHTEYGEDCIGHCERCYYDVCFICLNKNQERCSERICFECCSQKKSKRLMEIIFQELFEYASWRRTHARLKALKGELMMMTWKVERVEPWCGESWYID